MPTLGACHLLCPTVVSQIVPRSPGWCAEEWKRSQSILEELKREGGYEKAELKYTLPGPMTMNDMVNDNDKTYGDAEKLRKDLAKAVNKVDQKSVVHHDVRDLENRRSIT